MSDYGTRRSTLVKRRKGAFAILIPWLKRFGIMLGIGLVVLWCGAWFFYGGQAPSFSRWTEKTTDHVYAALGFFIRNVLVEGRNYTDKTVLKETIAVKAGDPLMDCNPAQIRTALEKLPWVKSARVERRWPDTLYIHLEERRPIARFQKNSTLSLVDEDGVEIKTDRISLFHALPIVMGEGAVANVPELIEELSEVPDLVPHITAARWVSGRRWDLILKNGATVKLPEQNISAALLRFNDLQQKQRIMDKPLAGIDLRETDRLIVEPLEGHVIAPPPGLTPSRPGEKSI